jgi:hypothetical protein
VRPRAPVGVAPVTCTDRTCFQVFGLEWRTLRTFLDVHGIRYQYVGRRPVVLVSAVLEALVADRRTWTEADTAREIEVELGSRGRVQ